MEMTAGKIATKFYRHVRCNDRCVKLLECSCSVIVVEIVFHKHSIVFVNNIKVFNLTEFS